MRSNIGTNRRVQTMSAGGQYRATAALVAGRMSPASFRASSLVGRFNRADDNDDDRRPKDDEDELPFSDDNDNTDDDRKDDEKDDEKPVERSVWRNH